MKNGKNEDVDKISTCRDFRQVRKEELDNSTVANFATVQKEEN